MFQAKGIISEAIKKFGGHVAPMTTLGENYYEKKPKKNLQKIKLQKV